MRESAYQARLIKKLRLMFPNCIILRNDPEHTQGVPDLIVLFADRWAALEVKASANSPQQPNQEYYVDTMNEMSFASFIYPENESEVLYHLQRSFESPW